MVSFTSTKDLSPGYKQLLFTNFLFIILGMPVPEHFKTTNYITHLVVDIQLFWKKCTFAYIILASLTFCAFTHGL